MDGILGLDHGLNVCALGLVMGKAALAGLGVFDGDLQVLRWLHGGHRLILRCGHRDAGNRKGQSQKQGAGLFHLLNPPDVAHGSFKRGAVKMGKRNDLSLCLSIPLYASM